MYKNKRILALIPARGGSKRLPGKNLKPLLGKPLVVWTIEQALASQLIDTLVVSTDNDEIAGVSKSAGASVPFKRPADLASDTASSFDVAKHAIDFLKTKDQVFDYLALLEPTSPLRKIDDIDRAIRQLIDSPAAKTLISQGLIHLEHPMQAKRIINHFIVPYTNLPEIYQSQQADQAFFSYGVIYLIQIDEFMKHKTFYPPESMPMFVERWQNYEVDDEVDFLVIETLMNKYLPLIKKEE